MGDAIAGLITLVLSFALGEAQKPFDWLLLCALLLSITVWWLVFGLTIEASPKDESVKDD